MKGLNFNIRVILSITLIFFIIIGCDTNSTTTENYYSNLEIVGIQSSINKNSKLDIDTFLISHPEGIGKGFSKVVNGELIFFDLARMEVRRITNEFELGEYHLTKGDGPNQIPSFQSFASKANQNYLLSSYTFFSFDQDWNYLNKGGISFYTNNELAEIGSDPKPDMVGIYELKYYEQEPLFVNDKLLIKIESSNPKYNFVMHKNYYEEARIAAEINLKSKNIDRILGRKPPIYINYNLIPHHDHHYWDINSDNKVYLSFEPDSLIYICDNDLVPQKAFGVAGINMRQDYHEVTTVEDYDSYWFLAQTTKGYYKHLKVIEEDGLVFRTYNQGTSEKTFSYGENPKRMQIYKDFELIADVPVPSFFKVIGKVGEYYYADGSVENQENEEVILYRFKLNE